MCLSANSCVLFIYLVAINLFGLLLRYIAFHDYFECFACKEMDFCKQDYDYIVVGSGSAGSIVARRLIEDKNIKVLLIEAGSNGNSLLDIPALGLLLQNSIFDWKYRTVPQKKACLGLDKQISFWPMGKIVGGTGMLNNMLYTRGHPQDFARWYKDKPNFNYSQDILPYFKKVENFVTNDFHSSVILNDLAFVSNLSDSIMYGARCLGYSTKNDGINSQSGFILPKVTMHNGRRWTPAHRLLSLKARNLVMISNSVVEKVLLRDNYEAYGVKYSHLDEHYYAKASKGVILAAGVIGSPKILMLSGIGPKQHLQKVKIPTRIDLPVGDNLQDHVSTGLDLVLLDTPVNMGIGRMMCPYSAFKYFVGSKGPWTTAGCENMAFFSTKSDLPDLEFMVLPVGVTSDNGTYLRTLANIGDKLWNQYFAKIDKTAITILPVVLHPKSRGTVRLKNKNPKSQPLIDPNYLTDSYDVDVLVEGIEMIKNFTQIGPMQRLGAKLNPNVFPGCEKFEFDTKPYWECYVRHLTVTSYHPIGTCKLGKVVDFDFKVKGTRNLYVVDGSVLPDLPSGNPNAAIMMMAEKAADAIKYHRFLNEKKSNPKEVFVRKRSC